MLFKQKTLELIADGKIDLAFRKWKRPTVKQGGTLITPVGQLDIISVEQVDQLSIPSDDLRRAGFKKKEELLQWIAGRTGGTLHRIEFKLKGDDPRIALRNETELTNAELEKITNRLKKMDQSKKYGAWTRRVLGVIDKFPERRAGDLAEELNMEKMWFKLQVRKLKGLGLTISMGTGYKISPRGQSLLKYLFKNSSGERERVAGNGGRGAGDEDRDARKRIARNDDLEN